MLKLPFGSLHSTSVQCPLGNHLIAWFHSINTHKYIQHVRYKVYIYTCTLYKSAKAWIFEIKGWVWSQNNNKNSLGIISIWNCDKSLWIWGRKIGHVPKMFTKCLSSMWVMERVGKQAGEIPLIQPAHIVSFLVSYPSLVYHTTYISTNTK